MLIRPFEIIGELIDDIAQFQACPVVLTDICVFCTLQKILLQVKQLPILPVPVIFQNRNAIIDLLPKGMHQIVDYEHLMRLTIDYSD